MNSVTISANFKICIPKKIRETLPIKAGQQFIIIPRGNSLQLVPKRELKDVRHTIAGTNTTNIREV